MSEGGDSIRARTGLKRAKELKATDPTRVLAVAMRRLETLSRLECLDPADPNSRPTPTQQEIINDFGIVKKQFVRAGNQCLIKGTRVVTNYGVLPIEEVRAGMKVFDEFGLPVEVLAAFPTGRREVVDLLSRGKVVATCTPEHRWLTRNSKSGQVRERMVSEFPKTHFGITRNCQIYWEGGSEDVPTAYALGALLGDGIRSGRKNSTQIMISKGERFVPTEVARVLGAELVSPKWDNYTYILKFESDEEVREIPYYVQWIKGRYAHEKIVDHQILTRWNRVSLLKLLAGLIDSDGSLNVGKSGRASLSIGMQAETVIQFVQLALELLFQIRATIYLDARDKYVNGPVHYIRLSDPHQIRRVMRELNEYIVSPQKKFSNIESKRANIGKRSKVDSVSVFVDWESKRIEDTFDITVDSPTSLYTLSNGLVTHNSGKTSVCVRNLSWALQNSHPTWKVPEEWRGEPLLAIVAGRTGKQIEESLLPRLVGLLEPGSYREIRIGNIVQKIEMNNGNRVIFQSLENPTIARERLQSYTAHIAWIDELPPTLEIIYEMFRCIQARNGLFMSSFTPLVVNTDIQRFIDSVALPMGKVYRLQMFDNPVYASENRKREILASFEHLPTDVKNCRLYGDWMSVDDAAYYFNYEKMVEAPQGYSPGWRHIESSDPATESALGLTLWAEDPVSGTWYCVREELLSRIYVPTDIVATVKKITEGYNIVRRISDPAATWYMRQAAHDGLKYIGVHSKNNRNADLIKQLQEMLGNRVKIAPWCTKLVKEIQEARWSDRGLGKIAGDNRFHLTASARYFCDNIPPHEKKETFSSWDDFLYRKNEERKQSEEKAKKARESGKSGGVRIRRAGRIQRGRGNLGGGLRWPT